MSLSAKIVPAELAGRHIALVAVLEAHEQSRRDHADDLALEDLVPAFFEKQPVEQERQHDVVGGALDQRRAAFVLGADLRDFGQLQPAAAGILEVQFAQERPVHDQVGVAADRRGEVQVGLRGQAEMAEVVFQIARLLERAQHDLAEDRAVPLLFGQDVGRTAQQVADGLAGSLGRARWPVKRRRRHAQVFQQVKKGIDRRGVRLLVDPVDAVAPAALQKPGHRLVGGDHELLDERVRFRLRARPHPDHAAVFGQAELGLEGLYGRAPRAWRAARSSAASARQRVSRPAEACRIYVSRPGRAARPARCRSATPSKKSSTSL